MEVWLALIPILGMLIHILHIYKITETLKKDFEQKKILEYKKSNFGKGNGLTYAYFNLVCFISNFLLVYFYLNNNYDNNQDFSNWIEFNDSIFKGLSFCSIVAAIHVINYWNKMLRYKAILFEYKIENSNLRVNNKSNYQNSTSYSLKNNKIEELLNIKILLDEKLITSEDFEILKSEIIGDENLKTITVEKSIVSPNNTMKNLHRIRKECPNCKISRPIYTRKCGSCGFDFNSSRIEEQNTIT